MTERKSPEWNYLTRQATARWRMTHGTAADLAEAVSNSGLLTPDELEQSGIESRDGAQWALAADNSGLFIINRRAVVSFVPMLAKVRRLLGLQVAPTLKLLNVRGKERRRRLAAVVQARMGLEERPHLYCRPPDDGRQNQKAARSAVYRAFAKAVPRWPEGEPLRFFVDALGAWYVVEIEQSGDHKNAFLRPEVTS